MAIQRIDLNIQTVSMDGPTADRLIRLGNGDAALLYLYLLRNQGQYDPAIAGAALHWQRGQLETALARLEEIGLASGYSAPKDELPLPRPEDAPDYSAADISQALQDRQGEFSQLVASIENLIGRKLINSQLTILLQIYDHIGLPLEVILTMVTFVYDNSKEKYGPGAKLSMTQLRTTAYRWKEQGYDTLEAVDEYIKNFELRKSREGAILSSMGIYGRKPSASEGRYINQWLEWNFSQEVVAKAADITVTTIGRLDWRYCNAILRRWHEAGHHTLQEVEAAQKQSAQTPAAGQAGAQKRPYRQGGKAAPQKDQKTQEQENRQNMLELQRFLAQMEQES